MLGAKFSQNLINSPTFSNSPKRFTLICNKTKHLIGRNKSNICRNANFLKLSKVSTTPFLHKSAQSLI